MLISVLLALCVATDPTPDSLSCCDLDTTDLDTISRCDVIRTVCSGSTNPYCQQGVTTCTFPVTSNATLLQEYITGVGTQVDISLRAVLNVRYQEAYQTQQSLSACNDAIFPQVFVRNTSQCYSFLTSGMHCCARVGTSASGLCAAINSLCNTVVCDDLESEVLVDCLGSFSGPETFLWRVANSVLAKYFDLYRPSSGSGACTLGLLATNLTIADTCYVAPSASSTMTASLTPSRSFSPSLSPSPSPSIVIKPPESKKNPARSTGVYVFVIIGVVGCLLICCLLNHRAIIKKIRSNKVDTENMDTIDSAIRKNNRYQRDKTALQLEAAGSFAKTTPLQREGTGTSGVVFPHHQGSFQMMELPIVPSNPHTGPMPVQPFEGGALRAPSPNPWGPPGSHSNQMFNTMPGMPPQTFYGDPRFPVMAHTGPVMPMARGPSFQNRSPSPSPNAMGSNTYHSNSFGPPPGYFGGPPPGGVVAIPPGAGAFWLDNNGYVHVTNPSPSQQQQQQLSPPSAYDANFSIAKSGSFHGDVTPASLGTGGLDSRERSGSFDGSRGKWSGSGPPRDGSAGAPTNNSSGMPVEVIHEHASDTGSSLSEE